MTKQEMDVFLVSIGGLERTYREYKGPIIDAYVFGVGEGWFELLKNLIDELISLGWGRHMIQSKEKFGGLNFYIKEPTTEMSEIILAYEQMSYTICERCGLEGSRRNDDWIKTLCDIHAEERKHFLK